MFERMDFDAADREADIGGLAARLVEVASAHQVPAAIRALAATMT